MSTAFRPQTDGQTERVNLVLQEYLRNSVNADQTDWTDHISMAEFNYNNTKHSRTGFSIVGGVLVRQSLNLESQSKQATHHLRRVSFIGLVVNPKSGYWLGFIVLVVREDLLVDVDLTFPFDGLVVLPDLLVCFVNLVRSSVEVGRRFYYRSRFDFLVDRTILLHIFDFSSCCKFGWFCFMNLVMFWWISRSASIGCSSLSFLFWSHASNVDKWSQSLVSCGPWHK